MARSIVTIGTGESATALTISKSQARRPEVAPRRSGWLQGRHYLVVAAAFLAAAMTAMFAVAETGPGKLRAAVPTGVRTYMVNGHPQTVKPFLGWTGWIYLWQIIGFGGGATLLLIFGYKSWTARRMHPLFALTLAAGGMFAFDPFYNWLGYFPTNPAFLHLPVGTTPWSDLAPTFEPVFFFPLYMVWLIVPALITNAIWTRLHARGVARRGEHSWSDRHPIISRLIVSKFVCFPLDLGGFRLGCLTLAFMFTQSPGPTLGQGRATQSQLLWEPLLFELTMMCTSLLMYRNKEGLTLQARAVRRLRAGARFPNLTEIGVAWAILAVSYAACLSGMAGLRFSGAATHLAQPWPYANVIAYDPDGLYKAACSPFATRPGKGNFDLSRPTPVGRCATATGPAGSR